jgi:hypothetical protein
MNGAFQLTEEVLYLQLPDGRRISLSFGETALTIHDISWNRYHMGEKKTLTRDAILAIEHSEIVHKKRGVETVAFKRQRKRRSSLVL